ncbi:hypothetical protein ACFLUS_04930 [Chloroflexota bacterium]
MMNHVTDAETTNSTWKTLYKVGGTAALITAVFIPIQIIVFIVSPPPSSVTDWFALFQRNPLLGLLDMDLLLVTDNVLAIPIFLAFYIALRRASRSIMTIAASLAFIGIAAYFASNTAFNMLSLSNQYVAAITEAQRSMLLAAGQAMLANYTGTAFQLSYVLGAVALITISVVMLRSNIFGKVTAYLGIAANVIALGLYVPTIGVYISIFSVLFLWVWYILIARKLFQLGQPR